MTDVRNNFTGTAGARVLESTSATGGDAISVVNPANTDAVLYSTAKRNPITGGTVAKLDATLGAAGIAELRYVRPHAERGAQQWLAWYTGLPTGTNVLSQMRSATFQAADLRMPTTGQIAGVTGSISGAGITPVDVPTTGTWLLVDEWIEQGTTATAPYNGKRKWRVRQVAEQPDGGFTIGAVLYEYSALDRYTGVKGTDQLTDYRVGDFTTTASVLPPMYLAWMRADDGAADYLSTPTLYTPAAAGAAAPEAYAYDAGAWQPREVWAYDDDTWVLMSTPLDGTTEPPVEDTTRPSSVGNFRVTAQRLVGTGSTAYTEVDVAFESPTDNVAVHKVRIRVDGVYHKDIVRADWPVGMTHTTTVGPLKTGTAYIITAITYDAGDTNLSAQPYPGVSVTTPAPAGSLTDTGTLVASYDPTPLTVSPVTSMPATLGALPALAQTNTGRQPALVTAADGRKYLRLTGDNLQTTTASSALSGAPGFTIHALVRVAAGSNSGLRQVYAQNANSGSAQRAALLLFDRKVRGAGRVLDADANLSVTGVVDIGDGQWHHIAVRGNAATKTMSTFVDGELDTTGPWQASQAATVMSATTSSGATVGGGTSGTEQLGGDLTMPTLYSIAQTDEQIRQTAALMPIPQDVAAPPPPPPLAATTTLTASSPYRVDISWPADAGDPDNQPWQVERTGAWPVRVLGPRYRSPHMKPGAKTFRYRKELTPANTTTGVAATYGPWIDAPGITIRAWPSITATATDGHRLSRWSLPPDWGQRTDVPGVRTVNITRTYTITAAGDYVLQLPKTGPLEVGRLDINVSSAVVGAVRFSMIGGEIHTAATAEIAMKLNYTGGGIPLYGFIKGVRFSGGNTGDAIQLNWSGTTDSTLVLQDILVDTIHGQQDGQHADVLQDYGGPATVLIDGLEGHSTYQGFMLNPGQFGLGFRTAAEGPGWYGEWGFTRVHFVGEPRETDGKASILYYLIATGASTKPEIVHEPTGAAGLFETWNTATAPPANLSNGVTLSGGVLVASDGDNRPGIWTAVQRGVEPPVGAIIDHSGPYAPGWAYVDRGAAPIPAAV